MDSSASSQQNYLNYTYGAVPKFQPPMANRVFKFPFLKTEIKKYFVKDLTFSKSAVFKKKVI